MKYTYLGRTGLYVSRIALGLWQAGDWGAVDKAAETVIIRRALDLGINFFDTAQAYVFGHSSGCWARRCATRRAANVIRS
jgi:aryl-alcohol dehydrogenase-like predicted oxidoreductase